MKCTPCPAAEESESGDFKCLLEEIKQLQGTVANRAQAWPKLRETRQGWLSHLSGERRRQHSLPALPVSYSALGSTVRSRGSQKQMKTEPQQPQGDHTLGRDHRVCPPPSPERPLSLTASAPHLPPMSHSPPTQSLQPCWRAICRAPDTGLVSLLGKQKAGLSPLSKPRTYECPAHKRHSRKISDSESQDGSSPVCHMGRTSITSKADEKFKESRKRTIN